MSLEDKILIRKFLAGQLTEAQEKQFSERQSDEHFLQLLEEATVKAKGRSELKAQLRQIALEHAGGGPQAQSGRRFSLLARIVSVAAAVTLLVAAGWLLTPKGLSEQQAFGLLYEPYPDITSVRGDDPDPALRSALQQYTTKNYNEAIQEFKKLEADRALTPIESFYLGQSFLGAEEAPQALPYFESVAESNTILAPEAEWYIVLCHLKMENKETAGELAQAIAENPQSDRQADAKTLLKKLKK